MWSKRKEEEIYILVWIEFKKQLRYWKDDLYLDFLYPKLIRYLLGEKLKRISILNYMGPH